MQQAAWFGSGYSCSAFCLVFLNSVTRYLWDIVLFAEGWFLPVHPVLSGSWSCSTTSPIIRCSISVWCHLFLGINTGALRTCDKHVFLEQPSQWKPEWGYLKVSVTQRHRNRNAHTHTHTHVQDSQVHKYTHCTYKTEEHGHQGFN